MKLLRLIPLLILLIRPNFTNSQDTLCIELNKYREILKLANKGYLCDSLITTYDTQVKTLEKIIQNKDEQLILSQGVINSQRNEIKKQKTKIIFLSSGLGVAILSIIILIL